MQKRQLSTQEKKPEKNNLTRSKHHGFFKEVRVYGMVPARAIVSLLVSTVIAFLLATSVWGLAHKYLVLRADIANLKNQQQELRQKSDVLADKNVFLATPEGQEVMLRKKFNLVKPGESVVMVAPEKIDAATVSAKASTSHFWDGIIRGMGF